MMSKLCTQIIMQFIEGTSFHASLGRTGMKKRASFEIFVHQVRTTVRKWELCLMTLDYKSENGCVMCNVHLDIFFNTKCT